MPVSIPVELIEQFQDLQDYLKTNHENIEASRKQIDYHWKDQMKRLCLSIVKDTERIKERNLSYLEDHDWHIYKAEDWIQKLEESDWS